MKAEILKILKKAEGYVSGQQLCEQLGVSRTAVWKAIRQLEEEGYVIEAVRNKGYRLVEDADVLTVAELRSVLDTKWLGQEVDYFYETDSTNNRARDAAEKGASHGYLAVADSQTAGDNNGFFTPNEKIDFSKVKVEPLFEEHVDFDTFSKSDFRAVKVKACEAVKKSKKLLQFTLDDGTGTDRTILSGIHAYYEPEELVGKTLIAITNLPPRAMMGIESCGMLLSAVCEENGEEKLNLLMVDNHIPAGAKLY